MKSLKKYVFLCWLIFITSAYIYISLKWLQNPFNKSPYDYIFSSVVIGTMILVSFLSIILRKRGYIIPLFLSLILVVSFITLSILSKTIVDLLIFFWIFVLGLVIGKKFIKLISKELPISWLENIIFSTAIGFGFYSFLILGFSLSGFLYKGIVFPVLILISIIFVKEIVLLLKEAFTKIKYLPSLFGNESNTGFVSALVSIILISLLVNFIGAIAPEIQYDALNYHLTVPRIYIENHKLVQLPHILQSYFAKSIEMLYVLGLILSGQITAKIFSLSFGVLIAVGIISLGKRFFSLELGIIAAALFYVCPLVAWLSTTTYIDLAVTFYIFSAIYALILWWKTASRGLLLLCGLMSGLALSVKLNAALVLLPTGLSIMAISYQLSGKSLSKNLHNLVIFGIPILIVATPWYLITYLHTGNPVFPFYNSIFKSPLWPLTNSFFNFKHFGMGYELKDFFLVPWNVTFHSGAFIEGFPDGTVGLTLLIVLPSIFFVNLRSSRIITLLILISIGFIGILFVIGQYLRYFLPILPILSLLAAYSLLYFKNNHSEFLNKLYSGIIITALMPTVSLSLVSFWNIPERIPYKVVFGLESPEEYLSRTLREYYAFKSIERYDNHKKIKVLLAGNPFLFYSNIHMENIITSLNTRDILETPSGERLLNLLLNKGFTHILVDKFLTSTWKYKPQVLDKSFLKKFTKLEFASQNIYIYKILKEEGLRKEEVHYELLENPGFEEIEETIPAIWKRDGKPIFDYSGKKSRTGKGAVKTSKKDFFTQVVPIEELKLYTLSHCTKSDKDNQFARLQINWLFEGKMIRPDIKVVPAMKNKWNCNSMSANAPEGARIAVIYASVHEDSEVWFDDFSFVQGVK